jgi:GAF domain-containing protein
MNPLEIVAAVGTQLRADRCWLYARDPARRTGIALARWLRAPDISDVPEDIRRWNRESTDLAARDPLFAHALAGAPLDDVDDIEHTPVDRELERALGHRAFIHLNLHVDGELWGTLQPGMTSRPRRWSVSERDALLELRPALAQAIAALVSEHGDALRSEVTIATRGSRA